MFRFIIFHYISMDETNLKINFIYLMLINISILNLNSFQALDGDSLALPDGRGRPRGLPQPDGPRRVRRHGQGRQGRQVKSNFNS